MLIPWQDCKWSFAYPNYYKKVICISLLEEALGDLGSFLDFGANLLQSSSNNHYMPWCRSL